MVEKFLEAFFPLILFITMILSAHEIISVVPAMLDGEDSLYMNKLLLSMKKWSPLSTWSILCEIYEVEYFVFEGYILQGCMGDE